MGGFGNWREMSEELGSGPLKSDEDQSDTQSFWSILSSVSGAEKKNDPSDDPEQQLGLLDSATGWMEQFRAQTTDQIKETTGLYQEQSLFGLSYKTRFKGFVGAVLFSAFFFFMAFFIGLPG